MSIDFSEVSDRLKAESNHLARYYELVEAKLKTAAIGLEAWVDLGPGLEIGYAKCAGKWQLSLRRGKSFQEPLCSTSRIVRMLAVSKIPELEAALLRSAGEHADEIQRILEGLLP
jgi:hypothetical protein